MRRADQGLIRRYALLTLVLLSAAASLGYGLHLVHMAEPMPTFFDSARAEGLRMAPLPENAAEREAFVKAWNRDFNALLTPKWHLHDRGIGLTIFSDCLTVAAIGFRLWRPLAVQGLKTPKPLVFAILGLLAYLSFSPITLLIVTDKADRGLLPVWDDSIGLPIVGMAVLTVLGLPFVPVILWILARAARQTASLWIWDRRRPLYSGITTAFAAVVLLGLLSLALSELIHGPGYALPTFFCLIYLTLASRAIVLSGALKDASRVQADG